MRARCAAATSRFQSCSSASKARRRSRICWQASFAAAPFMSAPELAAVGEVLATRVVLVVSMRTRVHVHAQGRGHDAADLLVDALAHLDRARGDADAAVGVDVHQRAGLVHGGVGEGDAEADRHHGHALLRRHARPRCGPPQPRHGPDVVAPIRLVPAARGPAVLRPHAVGEDRVLAQQVAPLQLDGGHVRARGPPRRWPPPSRTWPAGRRSRGRR